MLLGGKIVYFGECILPPVLCSGYSGGAFWQRSRERNRPFGDKNIRAVNKVCIYCPFHRNFSGVALDVGVVPKSWTWTIESVKSHNDAMYCSFTRRF